ncbi:MAG TPA: hypothetical protein VFG14_08060 [Chthoniobacteraceae bacterium]|nr:hypothetical protein [Chthoniobacteraceae bacterium]
MITANCRDRLTAGDFDFVVETLARSEKESVSLVELLTDGDTRDTVLDHPRLFQTLLEEGAPLSISPHLYFYILTRHVLKNTGLEDRVLTDYVASVLEHFSDRARMRSPANGANGPIQYVSDMLVALKQASPTQTFLIRAHIGNYSLFISGIFRESVQSRAQRGAPDLSFYEDMGRASYRAAASHQVAKTASLSAVLVQLADAFREVRGALNHLSDSLLHLDTSTPSHP